MSDVMRFNAALERLGSQHRVKPGDQVSEGVAAFFDALPSHIEKLVNEAVSKALREHAIGSMNE